MSIFIFIFLLLFRSWCAIKYTLRLYFMYLFNSLGVVRLSTSFRSASSRQLQPTTTDPHRPIVTHARALFSNQKATAQPLHSERNSRLKRSLYFVSLELSLAYFTFRFKSSIKFSSWLPFVSRFSAQKSSIRKYERTFRETLKCENLDIMSKGQGT